MRARQTAFFASAILFATSLACSSTPATEEPLDTGTDDVAIDTGVDSLPTTTPPPTDTGADSAKPPPPRRLPCLPRSSLASDLPSTANGALEGEIVSIVLPTSKGSCPADPDHLHLQVVVGAKRYDVAVRFDSNTAAEPMAVYEKDLPAASAAAGWSGATYDYQRDLRVASADFTTLAPAAMLSRLQGRLSSASLVSIHGQSYPDGTGLHNVHWNHGSGRDGVILIRGAGAGGTDHAIHIRFATDVF